MNELISAMALDMNISPYRNETETSFVFRVVYSGLGRWCLELGRTTEGISKHAQTAMLNNLTEKYTILFPEVKDMLVKDGQTPLSVFIRHTYEETGFLMTDSVNYNHLANYYRGLQVGLKKLLYGLSAKMSVEGLGVFSEDVKYTVSWREALLRDSLNCDEYIASAFDVAMFSQRNISMESLQFFNPKSSLAPSSSWINTMTTDKTVARNLANGAYYRVMKYGEEVLFYDDIPNTGTEGLTDFEYRRLYFALKKHYEYPLKARARILDEQYTLISMDGHLPNREYYLLLLCSWPYKEYCNKREFITRKENLNFLKEVLENLGVELIGG